MYIVPDQAGPELKIPGATRVDRLSSPWDRASWALGAGSDPTHWQKTVRKTGSKSSRWRRNTATDFPAPCALTGIDEDAGEHIDKAAVARPLLDSNDARLFRALQDRDLAAEARRSDRALLSATASPPPNLRSISGEHGRGKCQGCGDRRGCRKAPRRGRCRVGRRSWVSRSKP
jgi:hypothetical protein